MAQLSDIEVITWRKLLGNKLNLSLYPAMLTERSYRQNMLIAQIGGVQVEYTVV
jgi:hypothetical protein